MASDASHFAATIALTIDGLGPRGGGAHTPDEFVLASSLHERAEVALAIAEELTGLGTAEIKSLHFLFSADGFRWKGSPEGSSAKLARRGRRSRP